MQNARELLSKFSERFRGGVARSSVLGSPPSTVELEVRLGRFQEGRFVPGVTRRVFEQLEREMEESQLDADENSMEIVDYFYPHGRGGSGAGDQVRTRVSYDVEKMQMNKHHIVKRGGESLVLSSSSLGDMTTQEQGDQSNMVCRIAVADEVTLPTPPATVVTTHVRIKQRRCFRDVRQGGVVWIYELSKTWAGTSRSAVEHLQQHTVPTYEVEVELVDSNHTYLDQHDDAYIADSLLCKANALLGVESDCQLCVCEHKKKPCGEQSSSLVGSSKGGTSARKRRRG